MRSPNITDLPVVPNKKGWPWSEGSLNLPEILPDGQEWPRISIVTPSYNQGQFIEETIRSVLLQGYPNFEYFIMDGGSTDDSVEVIKRYDEWLTYWVSEQDGGQSCAVNNGWKKSTGTIIGWVNSDDLYMPGAFHDVAQTYHDNPKSIVICGEAIISDEDLRVKSVKKPYTFDIERLLLGGNVPGQPSVFIVKKVFKEIGGLDESLHQSMDRDYWVRISMRYPQGPYIYKKKVFAIARDWSGTKTATGFYNIKKERIRILEKAFSDPEITKELLDKQAVCFKKVKHRLAILAQSHAYASIEAGHTLAAWRYAAESWTLSPSPYGIWHTLRLFIRAIIPRSITKNRLKGSR
ncbi:MAG: glycosyltransferase family 2 protein [Arenicellales bacterium]